MFKSFALSCFVFALVVILSPLSAVAQPYRQINLVSDVPGMAAHTDPDLVNPWGLSRSAVTPWWVSDNGTGKSTLYNGNGFKLPLIVEVPPSPGSKPTGTVYNGGPGFVVSEGSRSGPATFLFNTEGGEISGWNSSVDPTHAILKVNNAGTAIYKGMTLATMNGDTFLYAANFQSGKVDVFTSAWTPATAPGMFVDTQLPVGYAPFNVQNIDGNVFVAFAKVGVLPDEEKGPGFGYVDEFDPAGNLIRRIQNGDWMNAPWGLAKSPATFGPFSNSILVGQFGSGEIAAFNPATGEFLGRLEDFRGPIAISGLWAIAFGGGSPANGETNELFFTAGIDDEEHGLFGKIRTAKDRVEQ